MTCIACHDTLTVRIAPDLSVDCGLCQPVPSPWYRDTGLLWWLYIAAGLLLAAVAVGPGGC
jgi:hypothetical protein